MSVRVALLLTVTPLLVAPKTATALQRIDDARRALRPRQAEVAHQREPAAVIQSTTGRRDVWWAPFASAIVPGTGQLVLEQDRAIAYLAVEGYGWLRYAADAREARRQRRSYRDLARSVARAIFPGPKPVGDFEYYERMESFLESGAYDTDPIADGLQPERDTLSFNGALWLKARRLFWEHPDSVPDPSSDSWRSAIEFYDAQAVDSAFRWSWRDAQLEHDFFRRTIQRSNEAFRRSIADLGFVIANHVLSTVDAYIAIRLSRGARDQRSEFEVSAALPWAPFGHP